LALEIFSTVKQQYKEGGLIRVLSKGVNKILYLLYHTNNAYWFRMDLRDGIRDLSCNGNISVSFNNPDGTIQYIKDYGYYYPKEIGTGLVAGHLYTSLNRYKGKIIGYNKTGYSNVYIEDFKRVYKFPHNVAYTYDIFVDPNYRNQNYGTFLLGKVCMHLKKRGFKSIWAHIPPWNTSSITMHQKLGFKRHILIRSYWVAGISWASTNPISYIQHIEDHTESKTSKK
jgi:ribosomal protein S18 acetylase RimI-like enzyme